MIAPYLSSGFAEPPHSGMLMAYDDGTTSLVASINMELELVGLSYL